MANKKIKIVTHSSRFHADDIFAVATLLIHLDGEDVEILRSRDKEVADGADFVVDTGDTYDSDKNRFDHHQKGGAGERDNGIPYASFGLVWKKFGVSICGSEDVSHKIDKELVQTIDARDNGVEICNPTIDGVRTYGIGKAFSAFLPTWTEDKNIDDVFDHVVSIAKEILERQIKFVKDLKKGQKYVEHAYNDALDKRLIILPENPVLDREVVASVLSKYSKPLYSVKFRPNEDKWQLACVRDDIQTYKNRKPLPSSWGGKRDEELVLETGVDDAYFCHNGLFMCLAMSKEGILKLAQLALDA